MAKLAYAKDLKSFSLKRDCGFDSRPGHDLAERHYRRYNDKPVGLLCEFDMEATVTVRSLAWTNLV